ncbi:MAG: hypothetical protein AAF705_06665 [Bacteroidota bacterium]
MLDEVQDCCTALDIDFFIVGALARNIWYVRHDAPAQGTQDVDFGIFVPDADLYQKLRQCLQEKHNYTPGIENAFCLISSQGLQVDLLPFGSIESGDYILVEGHGRSKLELEGFEEVFQHGLVEAQIGSSTFKASSIPGVVLLKLIAYDDRPEYRTKDLRDINAICQYYPEIETNFIWSEYFELYTDDRDQTTVAMLVLGLELKKLIGANDKLFNRVKSILKNALKPESDFLLQMIGNPVKETIEQKRRWISYIVEGLTKTDL